MKPTPIRDGKIHEPSGPVGKSESQRQAFKAGQRAAMQPVPQPKSHNVDPYTAALQEAQDGDSDIERATRGRVGPGSGNEDNVDVGPPSLQTSASDAQFGSRSGGEGENDETQSKAAEASGRATDSTMVSSAGPTPSLTVGERHSQAMLATVSMDRHESASEILKGPFLAAQGALDLPIMKRVESSSDRLNKLQMPIAGVGG